MIKKKNVFVTVFHPFITKNILDTNVFSHISSGDDVHVFLLVSDHKKKFFTEQYSSENVTVISVPISKLIKSFQAVLFSRISWLMMNSHYMRYKRRERLNSSRSPVRHIKFFGEVLISKMFSDHPFANRIFRYFFNKFSHFGYIKEIFDECQPDMFFSTDIFDEGDCLFAAEAKRRGVKFVGMIRSWDNCYSKGIMRSIPDKLIVNNETIKSEAHLIHQVPENGIYVLGSPQHDTFINRKRMLRDEFYRTMGMDPNKKLVIFAPAGTLLSDRDIDIVNILHKAIIDKKYITPVQFLIRNHPSHPADLESVGGFKNFFIEEPGKIFNKDNPKDTEILLKDNEHLADELYYADVVVWVATTLPLDAVIFDKPLVSVDFDGYVTKPYFKSVRKYHDEDHMKKMLSLNGVTIVNTPEELIESINTYIDNPLFNKEGREKIRKQQFYKLDGKSGKRIGEFLLNEIKS